MADDTIFTANDLGTLSGTLTLNDFVGTTDRVDYHRFALAQNGDLNLVFRSNPSLKASLIADLNNNGVVDSGETLVSGSTFFGQDISLFSTLPAGSYFVKVEQSSNNSADYELTLVETPRPGNVSPDPGNSLDDAFDLGTLSGSRTLKDYVGDLDDRDIYRFTLGQKSDLTITAKGLSGTVSSSIWLYLIADLNSNGVWDSGETIKGISATKDGNSFSELLSAGEYFVWTYPYFGNSSAQYEMTLQQTPDFSGNDRLRGTSRNDTLRGFEGNDTLLGLDGNDRLIGDVGNDRLAGGNDDDILDGGEGNDVLTTGTGRDRIILRRGQGFDRVIDFQDKRDKIDLSGISFSQLIIEQDGRDVLVKLDRTKILLIEDINLRQISGADFI
jgi:Ca2+-binding RTX toxin-like protein